MAIRGPRPDQAPAPQLRDQPASPLQRLVDFGMARTPQEAKKVLAEVLALLASAGFPVPKTGAPEQQLQTALKTFQRDNNLPVTGRLDDKTLKALDEKGLLPKATESDVGAVGGRPARDTDRLEAPPRPGFDLGRPRAGAGEGGVRAEGAPAQSGRGVETEQALLKSAQNKPDVDVDLKSMLGALRMAGFAGAGKGKEQLQDAVKKLQRADGLPVTGRVDAQTADALLRRGVIDSQTAQALREQDPAYTATTQHPSSSPTEARAASEQQPGQSAEVAGRAGERASADRADGAGAHGESGDVGRGHDAGDGVVAHGDFDGASDDIGNAYAGDLDEDNERRGRANVDDQDADPDEREHWEVPRLSAQIDAAIDAIARDDGAAAGALTAATYGWTLVLHRPGIYAAKQPAEELLRLTVTQAGPFDPVWEQAVAALNIRLRRYDPDAPPIGMERVRLALQRARYR